MSHASILILTLNEEVNLEECLASCAWSDDVVVFDSFSTDRTVEIAKRHGARVVQRAFDNYAAQRTAALREVQYRHPWVLMVDADERVTPELANEIRTTLHNVNDDIAMFRMRRRDQFLGTWLKRSSGYPTWFGRLVRPERVRVERAVNEEYHTDGGIGHLHEHLAHYPFNKGVAWWFERHNRYSTQEAHAALVERTGPIDLAGLFDRDPIRRRRSAKRLAYRLPGRPALVFLYLYIARLGFLDALPGLYFCAMRASYELMIDMKTRELARRELRLPL